MSDSEEGFLKIVGKDTTTIVRVTHGVMGRASKNPDDNHISLGEGKNISRKHVDLRWNSASKQWEIQCLGKNGMKLDGLQLSDGSGWNVITHKSKMEIGGLLFFVVMPEGSSK